MGYAIRGCVQKFSVAGGGHPLRFGSNCRVHDTIRHVSIEMFVSHNDMIELLVYIKLHTL